MSNLAHIATQLDRRMQSIGGISYSVSDATGTRSGVHLARGKSPAFDDVFAAVSRVMASAGPGMVAAVTIDATGQVVTVSAPGGAFDGRALSADPVIADGITSPATDAVLAVPGVALSETCRALFFGSAGVVYVRTAASPDVVKGPFDVLAGQILPLQVEELTAGTTATPIFALY